MRNFGLAHTGTRLACSLLVGNFPCSMHRFCSANLGIHEVLAVAVRARALPYISRAAEYMPQAMRAIDEDIARAHYLRDQATLRALEGIYGTDDVATFERREYLLRIMRQDCEDAIWKRLTRVVRTEDQAKSVEKGVQDVKRLADESARSGLVLFDKFLARRKCSMCPEHEEEYAELCANVIIKFETRDLEHRFLTLRQRVREYEIIQTCGWDIVIRTPDSEIERLLAESHLILTEPLHARIWSSSLAFAREAVLNFYIYLSHTRTTIAVASILAALHSLAARHPNLVDICQSLQYARAEVSRRPNGRAPGSVHALPSVLTGRVPLPALHRMEETEGGAGSYDPSVLHELFPKLGDVPPGEMLCHASITNAATILSSNSFEGWVRSDTSPPASHTAPRMTSPPPKRLKTEAKAAAEASPALLQFYVEDEDEDETGWLDESDDEVVPSSLPSWLPSPCTPENADEAMYHEAMRYANGNE